VARNVEVISFVFRTYPQVREQRGSQGGGTLEPRARTAPAAARTNRTASNTSSSRGLRFTHATAAGMGLGANPEAAVDSAVAGGPPADAEVSTAPKMREEPKIGRNDPCYCGSGRKYKHCHGR
jgi:preprotein translocase subunit SecA